MSIKPTAKVTLETSKGEITIELYAKELPASCKEFMKNCMSKAYNGQEFEKVSGDLIQLSQISNSIRVPHETHSRLKFNARGAVGLLRVDDSRDSSCKGFFISLKPVTEYSSEYVFIGNVVGASIYNVIKISESQTHPGTQTPVYPVKITGCKIVTPYFDLSDTPKGSPTAKPTKKTSVRLNYDEEGEEGVALSEPFVVKPAHELLGTKRIDKTADVALTQTNASALTQQTKSAVNENYADQSTTEPDSSQTPKRTLPATIGSNSSNKDAISEKKDSSTFFKPKRDPTIDAHVEWLDISQDEVDFESLREHSFTCK